MLRSLLSEHLRKSMPKETYIPQKETYVPQKETNTIPKRDLEKRPTQETYKRDQQQKPLLPVFRSSLLDCLRKGMSKETYIPQKETYTIPRRDQQMRPSKETGLTRVSIQPP